MFTLWLAERVAYIHSIELNPAWHVHIAELLAARRRENVRLELRDESNSTNLMEYGDRVFDLVIIVSSYCDEAIGATLHLARRPGGITYLDNTDQARSGRCMPMRNGCFEMRRSVQAQRLSRYILDSHLHK